jgi:hypothetical protein
MIIEMAFANPLWGAPRIHGELRKLAIQVSERSVETIGTVVSTAVADLADVSRLIGHDASSSCSKSRLDVSIPLRVINVETVKKSIEMKSATWLGRWRST